MHGIDFLWHHATHIMSDEMNLLTQLPKDPTITCYCCDRPSLQWSQPAFENRNDSYIKVNVPICAPCNALYHGSYKYMGIEKGTPEKPTASGKLGMLTGCGMIVSQKQRILLTNPGWDNRLKTASHPIFECHQMSGKGALGYALNLIMNLDSGEFPLLYVSDLGRKKAELVANLKLTLDKQEIYVCSADGVQRINTALLNAIQVMQQQDKAGWKKLSGFIFKSCNGQIAPNDEDLGKFLKSNTMALELAKMLPADPHEKLLLLRMF